MRDGIATDPVLSEGLGAWLASVEDGVAESVERLGVASRAEAV